MKTTVRIMTLGAILIAWAMITTTAVADPPDYYITKFLQEPMVRLELGPAGTNPQVYWGHDEESTAYLVDDPTSGEIKYQGIFMADDFADRDRRPVAHVKWWGSYMNDIGSADQRVKQFLICFESDVPRTADRFSHPGEVMSSEIVTLDTAGVIPGPGYFTEIEIRGPDPRLNEALFEYNAELVIPFPQKPDVVYWLKIVALVDPNVNPDNPTRWGWHNRDYTKQDFFASVNPPVDPGEHVQGHIFDSVGNRVPVWHFQDDAVQGDVYVDITTVTDPDGTTYEEIDVVQPASMFHEKYYRPGIDLPYEVTEPLSKDLAFQLYAVPEPSTVLLLAIGLGCLIGWRRAKNG